MKKLFSCILSLCVLAAMLLLPGCANKPENENKTSMFRGLAPDEMIITGYIGPRPTYTRNGEVIWNNVIPYGEYALVETKAPLGFILSTETWTVILEAGKAPVIKNGETDIVAEAAGTSFTFYFENEALYALPSTGGLGIYVPMTGGVIMMMAAAFILMNNKRKEVLER